MLYALMCDILNVWCCGLHLKSCQNLRSFYDFLKCEKNEKIWSSSFKVTIFHFVIGEGISLWADCLYFLKSPTSSSLILMYTQEDLHCVCIKSVCCSNTPFQLHIHSDILQKKDHCLKSL